LKNKSSLELAFSSIAVASFISFLLIIVSIMIQNDFTNLSINEVKFGSIISATILGVLCTGLAIWVFFKLIEKENAVFASQSNYLIPCFGFLWSFLFLDERLSFNLFIGLVLIVLGAFIVNNK
jgi:drug/metabolite transporter (DMT)-like permease